LAAGDEGDAEEEDCAETLGDPNFLDQDPRIKVTVEYFCDNELDVIASNIVSGPRRGQQLGKSIWLEIRV
jgi:hypothetical protein